MKKQALLGFLGLTSIVLSGCVTSMLTEQAANQTLPPTVETSSFDESTPGADTGTLFIQTRQPSYQLVVDRYAIKIDTNVPLVVAKQSDVTIKVNAGSHSLELYATSSDPAHSTDVTYGEPHTMDVVITKDQEVKLKYIGPYRLLGSGSLEEIK